MKNNCCAWFKKVIFFSLVIVCCVFSAIKKQSSVKELIEQEIKQQEVIPLINDDILQSVNAAESNKASLQVQTVEPISLVKQIQEKETKEKLVLSGNRAQSNPLKSKLLAPEVSNKVIAATNTNKNDVVQKKSNKGTSSEHSSHEFIIAQRTIAISNAITDDMITYKKHWSGNHKPNFTMKVNNQEIKNGTTADVIVTDDKLDVSFNYEFTVCKKTYRAGGKKLHYKVPQNVNKVTSTFSWDVNSNVVIDNAELLSSYEVG